MATASTRSLPPMYKTLAKKTLNENQDHVPAHLTSFRRWISSAPHLKVPNDDIFLLGFLRYAHFEHALAQKRLDNFCTLRCSDKVISQWYAYPQLSHPVVDTYLRFGIFVPLGFMANGIKVILVRLGELSVGFSRPPGLFHVDFILHTMTY
ncbi:Alpha tocopherol transfer protein [Fasciola gigantica]|uniref:Alpha tocopherol transfer protein n=1 Tax=Fasciola gigantica TaxID=46835 RepID=A0A504YVL8_FASGI|nr:Alpha tocopherol transfer protein [Fasciola gigantica]